DLRPPPRLLRPHRRRGVLLHQLRRVGGGAARARAGRGREPAGRRGHRAAGVGDPGDRADTGRLDDAAGDRHRGDHRRALPARHARDGHHRLLGLHVPQPARPGRADPVRGEDRPAGLRLLRGLLRAGHPLRRARPPDRPAHRRGGPLRARLRRLHVLDGQAGQGRRGRARRPALLRLDPRRPAQQLPADRSARRLDRGDRRRRQPVRGGDRIRGPEHRRAHSRARARARPARHRAAREAQQRDLGARGQGQPGAREHHRGDGLPVDAAGGLRHRLHVVGASARGHRGRHRRARRGVAGLVAAAPAQLRRSLSAHLARPLHGLRRIRARRGL
ncbi:MAG: Sodium/calcium exchanger membrane region, partial [uncultured Solirubrobacterales bacterium]